MKDINNILDKILSLLKRFGARSVTMDDISRELGMSKKTLYQEFADKDDLINRVIDFDMEQSRVFLEQVHHSESNAVQELLCLTGGCIL